MLIQPGPWRYGGKKEYCGPVISAQSGKILAIILIFCVRVTVKLVLAVMLKSSKWTLVVNKGASLKRTVTIAIALSMGVVPSAVWASEPGKMSNIKLHHKLILLQNRLAELAISDLSETVLYIDSDNQTLELWQAEKLLRTYDISTAAQGLGNENGSYKTPVGIHRIAGKIGTGERPNTIFRGRRPTGEYASIEVMDVDTGLDQITSRIMRLRGEEPGINLGGQVDTYERYIYIHGTNEEGRIGQAASHGCIRMRNHDVIELYDRVGEGTLVIIN